MNNSLVVSFRSDHFFKTWLATLVLTVLLTTFSIFTQPYRYFPAYGVVGYTFVILLLLYSLAQAEKRWHFILAGLTLVIAGAAASIDIVLSRNVIVEEFRSMNSEWAKLLFTDDELVANLVNIMVILLNIFTSSLAANVLFHGLNKKNFRGDKCKR